MVGGETWTFKNGGRWEVGPQNRWEMIGIGLRWSPKQVGG